MKPKPELTDIAASLLEGCDGDLEIAFTILMRAADRAAQQRAEQASDDDYDNMPMNADPGIYIKVLVEEYNAEQICQWAKQAVRATDEQ